MFDIFIFNGFGVCLLYCTKQSIKKFEITMIHIDITDINIENKNENNQNHDSYKVLWS